MRIRTNAQGADRKRLVADLAAITGEPSRYLGLPTLSYEVGDLTVLKDGRIAAPEESQSLIDELKSQGWEAEAEKTGLTITLPASKMDVSNMEALLKAKGTLIRHALGIDALPMEVSDGKVSFPWFASMPEEDDVLAATSLIEAMAKRSRRLTRVTAKDLPTDNEKYAFRCFLLRLGFKGDDKKAARKALLRRLTGNSAFRHGKEESDEQA